MATIKVKRRVNSDTAGSLSHGELGISQTKLWYGDQTNTAIEVSKAGHAHTGVYLPLTGGTLTGGLITPSINTNVISEVTGPTYGITFNANDDQGASGAFFNVNHFEINGTNIFDYGSSYIKPTALGSGTPSSSTVLGGDGVWTNKYAVKNFAIAMSIALS